VRHKKYVVLLWTGSASCFTLLLPLSIDYISKPTSICRGTNRVQSLPESIKMQQCRQDDKYMEDLVARAPNITGRTYPSLGNLAISASSKTAVHSDDYSLEQRISRRPRGLRWPSSPSSSATCGRLVSPIHTRRFHG
jgi:hypothetical protein